MNASPATVAPSTPAPATAAPAGRPPLTKEQRDAIFAATAAAMQPARSTVDIELIEWKPQIMAYYRKGFSAVQIRDMLKAGGLVTSERVVQRFIAKHTPPKRPASARRSSAAGANPPPASATPAPTRATEAPAGRQSAATPPPSSRQAAAKNGADSDAAKRT